MFSTGRHKLLYTIRNTASRLPRFVAQRCVAKSTGTLLTQGRGVFGSLGQGTKLLDSNSYNHTVSFDSISDSCDGQANISLAAAGWGHSAVLTGDGLLYIFGRPYDFSVIMRIDKIYRISNWVARYISASSNSLFFGSTVGYFPTPTRIETNEKIVGLSCSAGLTIFLTEIGNVYTFGLNRWGQCGVVPDDNAHIFQPTKVNGLPACQKIDAGLQHCIALTTEGEVYTWGKGNKGQLGTIADTRDLPPFALPALVPLEPLNKPSNLGKPQGRNRAVAESSKQIKAKSISAGFSHSAALSSEGSVYVWGKGMALEYKEKNAVAGSMKVCDDQLTPRKVNLPGDRKAVEICSSNFNLVILAEDGSLWALGMGEHDRNANPEPLRVQTDFHPPVPAGADPHSAHYRSKARAEVGPSDGDPYLLLPVGGSSTMAAAVTMCKGHQRVSLITPEPLSELLPVEQEEAAAETGVVVTPSAANRRHFPNQGIFEVVVHGGEAYLIEMVLPIGVQQKNTNSSNSSNSKYKVVGLSTGWRHSLMIVENA